MEIVSRNVSLSGIICYNIGLGSAPVTQQSILWIVLLSAEAGALLLLHTSVLLYLSALDTNTLCTKQTQAPVFQFPRILFKQGLLKTTYSCVAQHTVSQFSRHQSPPLLFIAPRFPITIIFNYLYRAATSHLGACQLYTQKRRRIATQAQCWDQRRFWL